MPQLHAYVPQDVAARLHRKAESKRLTTSRYLAEIIRRDVGQGWPEGFFDEVVGGWQGPPLERPLQPQPDERPPLVGAVSQ